MRAPLRWTTALVAVGALGFFAGQYLRREKSVLPGQAAFPLVVPAGPSASASSEPGQGIPRRVPSTIREILKLPGDFTQTTALYVLAASQDRKGIERLLDEAKSIDRHSESRAAASILYERYAELDPAAAVEHMMRDDTDFDPNWLYGVFHSWARSDLDGAVARASKLDDRARQMVGTAIVRSRDDLTPEERSALGKEMNVQVSVRDPTTPDLSSPKAGERAWQNALAMTDRGERARELYMLSRNWAQRDPHAAIRAIESLRDRQQREQLLQVAAHGWAEKDARQAFEWTLDRPASQMRLELLASVLGVLVAKEPTAAMAMTERLTPAERNMVMPQVLMNWTSNDPRAVTAWIAKQDDRQSYVPALATIAGTYAELDPDEALRWAATLSGEDSQIALTQVIQQIAQTDPERAGNLVGEMEEGDYRNNAMSNIAQVWGQSDPRAALSWVAKQPQSESTAEMYRGLFTQWSVYDIDGAVSQLNFILDPGARNAAILGILGNPYLDPSLIGPLYQRVEGVEARNMAAARIYYQLRETDPAAAERYRRDAGISDQRDVGTIVVN